MSDRWMELAACRGRDPEVFFPDPKDHDRQERARHICSGCPVQSRCREFADSMHATHGVWGGQFRNMDAYIGPEFVHVGSEAGFRKHYRRGEKPCEACRKASNRAVVDRRHGIKPKTPQRPVQQHCCGTMRGYRQHVKRGERPCRDCKTVASDRYRKRYPGRTSS